MDLNINIDPEQINKMVAEAVLDSAIGEQVRAQVKKSVAGLGAGYNNPIEGVINQHIRSLINQVLVDDYADDLKTKVHEAVSGKITDEFISEVIEAGFRRL